MSEPSEFLADPEQPVAELLALIRAGAVADSRRGGPAYTTVPLSALLAKLGKEAADRAAEAEKTATRLIKLTWALLLLTVALVLVAIVPLLGCH